MAPGTLIVPVLINAGPMQRIACLQLLIRIEMIPTLATIFLRTRVPRYSERLKATARKLDEVLL